MRRFPIWRGVKLLDIEMKTMIGKMLEATPDACPVTGKLLPLIKGWCSNEHAHSPKWPFYAWKSLGLTQYIEQIFPHLWYQNGCSTSFWLDESRSQDYDEYSYPICVSMIHLELYILFTCSTVAKSHGIGFGVYCCILKRVFLSS
jgi:hypothetical protein